VHAFPIQSFGTRQLKKVANNFAADVRSTRMAGNAESISTAGDFYVQAALDLSQVLIELSEEIGEAVIVGGFEDDVLGCFYGIQCLLFEPLSG
jgi:hypothetical protein